MALQKVKKTLKDSWDVRHRRENAVAELIHLNTPSAPLSFGSTDGIGHLIFSVAHQPDTVRFLLTPQTQTGDRGSSSGVSTCTNLRLVSGTRVIIASHFIPRFDTSGHLLRGYHREYLVACVLSEAVYHMALEPGPLQHPYFRFNALQNALKVSNVASTIVVGWLCH